MDFKFQNTDDSQKEQSDIKRPLTPPDNRDQWLKRQGYKVWPMEDELGFKTTQGTDEPSFHSNSVLGSLEEIKQDLRDHAGWDDGFFNDVDARLTALEKTLSKASKQFMADLTGKRDSNLVTEDGLRMVRIQSHKLCDTDVLRAKERNSSPADKRLDGRRIVEEAHFPGFPGNLAPLLPGKIETLFLLDTVTKSQNFSPMFLKSWRKIAFSDASTSFLQFCYWWLWIDRYAVHQHAEHRPRLYTKMAECFTELVMMTDGRRKDDFFEKYPSCVSQAIYSVYCQAFPNSIREFYTNEFRQWLCNSVYELTTGIPSPVECWTVWPMKALDPTYISDDIITTTQSSATSTTTSQRPTTNQSMKMPSHRKKVSLLDDKTTFTNSPSSVKHRVGGDKSPGIGSGPVFENVRFGTISCSPLLQHQLWVHGLLDSSQINRTRQQYLVSRTQIKELPRATMTYSELITTVKNLTQQRYQEYSRELAVYEQEIHKAVQDFYAARREMRRETKKILQHKDMVSLEADKIMAAQFSSAKQATTNTAETIKTKGLKE